MFVGLRSDFRLLLYFSSSYSGVRSFAKIVRNNLQSWKTCKLKNRFKELKWVMSQTITWFCTAFNFATICHMIFIFKHLSSHRACGRQSTNKMLFFCRNNRMRTLSQFRWVLCTLCGQPYTPDISFIYTFVWCVVCIHIISS